MYCSIKNLFSYYTKRYVANYLIHGLIKMSIKKLKMMILIDSLGNPRSFPVETAVILDKTYLYKIREVFEDAIVWQLSYGNISIEELTNQVIGYLNGLDGLFSLLKRSGW